MHWPIRANTNQSFDQSGAKAKFSRAWHPLYVFPRLAPIRRFPAYWHRLRYPKLGTRYTLCRAWHPLYLSSCSAPITRLAALSYIFYPALVTSLFAPVFPAFGTSYLYPSKVKYRFDEFPFLSLFSSLRSRKYGSDLSSSFFCYFFRFFFGLFYLTRRATIAKIRQATPTGLENKVLLLLSSNILKFLAV